MRRKKSNFSNRYFEKKYYRRRKVNIPKEEKLYYSTEIIFKDDDLIKSPQINIYVVSLDNPKVQKEMDNNSYQNYLRNNYSFKKGGNYNE